MATAIKLIRPLAVAGLALIAAQASADAFNGPYVGATLGWQQDKADIRSAPVGSPVWTTTVKGDGFSYGGFLGYNFNVNGNGVIGLEGSLTGTSGDVNVGGVSFDAGTRWDIVARAGALISPQTLVYARGGYTNQKYSTNLPVFGQTSESKGGWTLGAGLEQAVSANITGRVEYNYAQYSRFEDSDPAGEYSIRPKAHAIRVGVAYNF